MVEMDIKDKKILYYLNNNSRQSFTSIGKKVELSKEKVRYKIKRLEDYGVITQYNTLINIARLGYGAYRFYYTFQFASPEIKQEIIDYFIKSKLTTDIFEFEGAFDLQVSIFGKIPDPHGKIISFYEETQRKYRDYFDNQIGVGVYFAEMFDLKFLLGEDKTEPKAFFPKLQPPAKLDDIDIKILQLLIKNSRIPTIDIAKELKSTVTTIRSRIKNLIKEEVILRYTILIDWRKIGYQSYIVEINLKNYSKKHEIIAYVRKNPNLWCIQNSLGHNVDLEFEFLLQDISKLHEIIKDLSTRFPESIKNFKYSSVLKIYKWCSMPPM